MRTIRTFIEAALHPAREMSLPEAASNHLIRVLRLQPGDRIHLFNGDGNDYLSEITGVEKKGAKVRILDAQARANESPLRIHLYQSIARGEKMDWILQKATELGVAGFSPMLSDRTEVKIEGERSDKKRAHWLGVIRSACEQSGRATVPELHAAISLSQIPAETIPAQAYYLQPDAEQRINGLSLNLDMPVSLAIGPEGGFSDRDIQRLQTLGFTGLCMGPRILRTETAGIAAIAALQSRHGDW